MADENISIEISDGVAPSIAPKLKSIADNAREGETNVSRLTNALKLLGASSLDKLTTQFNNLNSQMLRNATTQNTLTQSDTAAALARQKLATETQRTQTAMAQAEASLNRAVAAETNANAATTRLSTAQQTLAASTVRVSTAQNQAQTSAQRLATEEQRTAVQTANAAAAADRAALASIRLAKAQNDSANASNRAGSAIMSFVKGALLFAGVTFGTQAIIETADAYTLLQNKLQNVATSQAQVNELTEELFTLANNTRSSVDATTTALTRFDRSLKSMGKSQEETLRMTETVNKGLAISGATASESASALLQLSQAFNSGKLQGEEFRAISENMPIVLDAVAKSLNIPIGKVKEFATEGKISSRVLFDAFKLIEKQIDDTFAKTTPTIAQSLQVLSNNSIKFFGELNKATGFSVALSTAIIALSNNLDVLAVVLTTVGAAMLVYFGPTLLTAISTATRAVIAFNLALAANPIGLIVVGIVALTAAFVAFGDKIKVTEDGLVSIKDVALSIFEFIGKGFSQAANIIESLFVGAIDYVTDKFSGFGGVISDVLNSVISTVKLWANSFIAPFVFAFEVIKNLAKGEAPEIAQEFADAFNKDYIGSTSKAIGNAWGGVIENARMIAWNRQQRAMQKTTLRGPGADETGSTTDEKRSTALAKVNAQLDNQLQRLFMLKPAREAQAEFDKIEENLIGKKIKLTAEESAALKEKINTIQNATQVQAAYDRIYESAISPFRDYNATIAAANKLFEQGAISQARYQQELTLAIETYKVASDPLYKLNKEMEQQLDLLEMLPKQREIEQQIQQISNDLLQKGITLNQAETQAIREKLQLMQQTNAISQQEAALMDSSQGRREAFITQLQAIKNLMANPDAAFSKSDALNSLSGGALGDLLGGSPEMMQAQIDALSENYARIDELRQADLISEQTANAAKIKIWNDTQALQLKTAVTAFTALEGLSKSKNKKLAAIGKAAAVANALVQTYQSAVSSYASLASIPYIGPALGFAAAAAAVTAGLANVAQIRSAPTGFSEGGYTGNIPTNKEAGVVHGQEFVMNAEATKRIGVSNLQAMQDGAASVSQTSNVAKQAVATNGGSPKLQVIINNKASGVEHQVNQIDENTVEIIAERVVRNKTDEVTAGNLSNPSSKTSRSLSKNTRTTRTF